MSYEIFAETAPEYFRREISVIPLRRQHKAPAPNGWQVFCSTMAEPDTQRAWIERYADGNIGLPLGPANQLVAIDLDTDDPKITELIEKLLPTTKWVRRGKKGAVYMYRSPRGHDHRTFRIKDIEGKSLVECLAKGTQIVLPPSIHPETQKPYTATCDLWDVINDLPILARDIETILRGALTEEGHVLSTRGSAKMVEWVAAGNRDSSMVSICGLEARAVVRAERTLAEAFGEVETWIANFTEKVAGDSLDPAKARAKIIEFIKRDIVEGKRNLPVGWDEGLSEEERAAAAKEFGEDSEEWTVERCTEFLDEKLEQHDRRTAGRRAAIDEVLGRLARSRMTTLEKDQVLNHIYNCSGKEVTLTSLRKRMGELEKTDIEGTNQTEIAEAFIKEVSRTGEIRFEGDRLHQWAGSHWVAVEDSKCLEIIAREFGSLQAARRHNDHKGILSIARNLVPKGLKNSPLVGINFANGYLTADLVLHPHKPEFGCTYVLPYCYDAALSSAPQRFLSFLYHSWGEDPDYEDKVQALREAIAATMFQQAWKFQKAICLHGVPGSGKSVLKGIVLGLLPDGSVSTVRPHDWNDKFLPTQMHNKLINYCGELSETQFIPDDHFKTIIEGGEVSGQHKNRPIFQFRPLCAQWFNSNHLPRAKDSSAGFTRRWLFLRFNKAVPQSDKIVGLDFEILSEEREAIAAWAVQVMPQLMANNGYTVPKSSDDLSKQMAGMNNCVRFFLERGPMALVADGSCLESDLHARYWQWCRSTALVQPLPLNRFRARMDELQKEFGMKLEFEKMHLGEVAVYRGIKLL